MTIEAMKALSCLVIRPLGQHQQAMLPQDLKQPVSPDLDPPIRLAMQQVVQLSRTQAGLAHPDLLNKLNDTIRLARLAISNSITFVVSLSADTQKLTSPGNAQSCDLALREDLPDRFFTTETP